MIVINCMRYLDITDFNVIDRMTILEFELRMRAYQLKQLDKERDMYQVQVQMMQKEDLRSIFKCYQKALWILCRGGLYRKRWELH